MKSPHSCHIRTDFLFTLSRSSCFCRKVEVSPLMLTTAFKRAQVKDRWRDTKRQREATAGDGRALNIEPLHLCTCCSTVPIKGWVGVIKNKTIVQIKCTVKFEVVVDHLSGFTDYAGTYWNWPTDGMETHHSCSLCCLAVNSCCYKVCVCVYVCAWVFTKCPSIWSPCGCIDAINAAGPCKIILCAAVILWCFNGLACFHHYATSFKLLMTLYHGRLRLFLTSAREMEQIISAQISLHHCNLVAMLSVYLAA